MSRVASDAVALLADARLRVVSDHLPGIAARSKAFDPRAPLGTMGMRCFMRSNAIEHVIERDGRFAEPGTSRHAVRKG